MLLKRGSPLMIVNPERSIDWKLQLKMLLEIRGHWLHGRYEKTMYEAHAGYVYSLQFDNQVIVSGSRDNTIKVWDMATRCCLLTLEGHTGSVLCLQFDETKIISGSSDSTIKIWDIRTGALLHTLSGHSQAVLGIRFKDNILVSCSKDKS